MKITDVKLHTLVHPTLTQSRPPPHPSARPAPHPIHPHRPPHRHPHAIAYSRSRNRRRHHRPHRPHLHQQVSAGNPQDPRHRRKPLRPRTALPDAAQGHALGLPGNPAGLANSTTASGTSSARPPASLSTPSSAACATACPSTSPPATWNCRATSIISKTAAPSASTPTNCTPTKAAKPTSPSSPTCAKPSATTTTCSTIPSAHTTCAKPSKWAGPWKKLDYIWLEEPMHEQKMNQYQELCRTLTIPHHGHRTPHARHGPYRPVAHPGRH